MWMATTSQCVSVLTEKLMYINDSGYYVSMEFDSTGLTFSYKEPYESEEHTIYYEYPVEVGQFMSVCITVNTLIEKIKRSQS